MRNQPWPFGGRATPALIAAVAALFLASCGDSASRSPARAQGSAAGNSPLTTAEAGATHEDWAAQGLSCEECHPCGRRGGHTPEWSNPASPGFHAEPANRNIASCTACHGATLDEGVGFAVACGSCHDQSLPAGVASWKVNCTMCHGGTNDQTGAPPKTTWGHSADAVRVGAHDTHVKANIDCAAGSECVNAVCRVHCWADADCNMCVGKPVCSLGYCMSPEEIAPQCKLNVNCAAGQTCINATCQ